MLVAFGLLCFEFVLVALLGYGLALRSGQPPALVLRSEGAHSRLAQIVCDSTHGATQLVPFKCNDAMDASQANLALQVRLWQGVRASETLAAVTRDGKPVAVKMGADGWNAKRFDVIDLIDKLVLLSLAVFIIARGRGRLALLGGLALYGIAAGAGIRPAIIDMPAPVAVLVHFAQQALLAAGLFSLTLLAIDMLHTAPSPDGGKRVSPKTLELIWWAGAALALAVFFASTYRAVVYPFVNSLTWIGISTHLPANDHFARLYLFMPPALAMILPVIVMGFAVARASRENAPFYRWIFASTGFGLLGTTIWLLYTAKAAAPELHAIVLTQVVMGAGYAYAFTRRRFVDVAFVINRAAVLGVIGVIIAAIVVGLDRWIDPRVETVSQSASLLVLNYVIILALGLSVRMLEPPVEWLVERLLFVRRYRIKRGLAELRDSAGVAESADGFIQTVTQQLRTLVGARTVALYEQKGDQLVPIYIAAGENESSPNLKPLEKDDAISRRISSSQDPAEARGLTTELPPSAVAFPMRLAGHLIGAVVVERQSELDPYDPDLRAQVGRFVTEFTATLLYLRSLPVRVPRAAPRAPVSAAAGRGLPARSAS
ncbi:MAG: hypothetical protein WAK16_02865 [Candidatus Cybelea sp.]